MSNKPSAVRHTPTTSVCVVGPDPALNVSGGVATHLRILRSLDVFSNATFCDVGSRNGPKKSSVWEVLKGYINLYRHSVDKDFVLTNGSISAGSLLKVCLQLLILPRKRNRSVFVFFHGGNFKKLGRVGRCSVMLLKALGRRVDSFYFLSELQRESFLASVGQLPTRRYRNFSASDATLPPLAHGEMYNLLYVGRITEDKGVFESLDALRTLLQEKPNRFRLIFVGDGDAVAELRKKVTGNLEGAVEFKGYLKGAALEYEYQCADLVLLPSSHEGFPYVFIEAMRAGVPMVATRVGALPDLIKSGENGYLVERKKESLFETILMHFESDLASRMTMRENCYTCFRETLGRTSAEIFYSSLLAK